jgi:hypothetical protein
VDHTPGESTQSSIMPSHFLSSTLKRNCYWNRAHWIQLKAHS